MSNRVYVVTQSVPPGDQEVLVRAATAAQAIRHASKQTFSVKVANQDDLIRLAKTHNVEEA